MCRELRGVFILALLFVAGFYSFMHICVGAPTNGTTTRAVDEYPEGNGVRYFVETATITTAADGEYDDASWIIYGFIDRITINPSTGLTPLPTNLFDVHLRDLDDYDLLNGQGLNLSNARAQSFGVTMAYNWSSALDYNASSATHTYDPPLVMGTIKLEVDNAGNQSSAIIRIYGRGHSSYIP